MRSANPSAARGVLKTEAMVTPLQMAAGEVSPW